MSKQSRLNKAKAEKDKARASDDARQTQATPQQPPQGGSQREMWEPSQGSLNRQQDRSESER